MPVPAPYVFGRSTTGPSARSAATTSSPIPPTTLRALEPGV